MLVLQSLPDVVAHLNHAQTTLSTPKVTLTASTTARKRPSVARLSIVPKSTSTRSKPSLIPESTRKKTSVLPVKSSLSKRPAKRESEAWEDLLPSSPPLKALEEALSESTRTPKSSGLPRQQDAGYLKTPLPAIRGSKTSTGKRKGKASTTIEDLLALPLNADGVLQDSPVGSRGDF
jgi:hypothetical protein